MTSSNDPETLHTEPDAKFSNLPKFSPDLAFPRLSPGMLERLAAYGIREEIPAATQLFARGSKGVDLFILLQGTADVHVEAHDTEPVVLASLGPGQFTGELDLLSARCTLVSVCTRTPCLVIRIRRDQLQEILRSETDVATLILQASMWRRLGFLGGTATGATLYGDCTSAKVVLLQRFLTQNSYPNRVKPAVRTDAGAGAASPDPDGCSVELPDGTTLSNPSLHELAEHVGLLEQTDPDSVYDLVVVGAGPAGLAAAVYGASEGLSTLLVESIGPGGQAGTSSRIENYLGFPLGVSGDELTYRAQVQAQKFGTRLIVARPAVSLRREGDHLCLRLADETCIQTRSVVIATGAQYRKLPARNYSTFENRGIQYAATAIEANLSKGQPIAIVGGGNSAGQAAIFLSGFASHVHLVIRKDALESTMSQYLVERVKKSSAITLHTHTEIEELQGSACLESILFRNLETGAVSVEPITHLFVMIGAEPHTRWLAETLALDGKGFILAGPPNGFNTSRYATSASGVFAVGDVRSGSVKRVASAVGEGSVVVSDVHEYLTADARP